MALVVTAITVIAVILSGGSGALEPQPIGCFKTDNYVDNTTVQPLTFEICIHLCTNQATRYVGVQSSQHLCYCMNDLIMISNSLSSKDCEPCYENVKRFCGGGQTMSVYELPEHGSNLLLAATSNGVFLIKDMKMNAIEGLTQDAKAVDFHYREQLIFYSSKNKLFRSSYIPHLMHYFAPTILYENEHQITDFVVDWVKGYIYVSLMGLEAYYKMKLDGSEVGRMVNHVTDSDDMGIDPYTRMLYGKYKGKLMSYDFSDFNTDVFGKYLFKKIKSIAVDIHQETVYVIGGYDGTNEWHLASINYNYTHFRVMYTGPELNDPFGLEVLNGRLFWINRKESKTTVYKADISVGGYLQNLTIVYNGNQKINGIKIYHPDAQTPSKQYICKMKHCSQECIPRSHRLATCSCSGGLTLAEDGITCVVTSTSTTEYDEITLSSTQGLSLSTDEWDYWTKDVTSTSDLYSDMPNEISDGKTTTHPPATLAGNHPSDSDNQSLLIHLMFDVIIICFLLVILLLGIKQQDQIRHLKMFYNRSSDLAELTFDS